MRESGLDGNPTPSLAFGPAPSGGDDVTEQEQTKTFHTRELLFARELCYLPKVQPKAKVRLIFEQTVNDGRNKERVVLRAQEKFQKQNASQSNNGYQPKVTPKNK